MPAFDTSFLGATLRLAAGAVFACLLAPVPAPAQGADPIVAKVNGQPIRMSDVNNAAQSLPPQARAMDPQQLLPLLIDQLIDAQALLVQARKQGLDKDPEIQRDLRMAEERTLESAMLHKAVAPKITEEAIKARYDRDIGGKPAETEVHARHILVPDEATAKKIIAELKKGGDFAGLSKQYSKDPGAAQQGGDLGFFKEGDMVPEFAKAAFALKDNETVQTPVKTQFGYHIIQTLERRKSEPQPLDQVHDELRQSIGQEAVRDVIADAVKQVSVERFNMDGSPIKATDTAVPPPAK
jgi:peptidyl-prolyl cis-trans isomerase C